MSASKRDELVQKALASFYKGGFHAIGMDRLAKETGVSKTAIYKHFRTKEELILATLRLRDEQFRNWLRRRVEALATDGEDRLLAIFDALGEWFEEPDFRSCMFIKASSEYQDSSHPIHATAAEHKRLLSLYFTGIARETVARDPESLARQLLVIKEGAIVLAHLRDHKQVIADAKAAAASVIDAALAR
ncbi:TetR family transcriptional regulator [Sphingorhabdus sp. YGSMI21]|uniref:TetR/AcrR family transcriptional regulator n=1 Tax=Sphingorhabdus sp. YGSMI21 TaxID=2077182 RepID=UPI000C1EAE92|nr:TetR family transcriptional regulator [Sphingorhabdus sp. YGSMI21]ATW02440.1 TetR family transcriptional regulator [Sphingorhabdus sp. YGSMI21]